MLRLIYTSGATTALRDIALHIALECGDVEIARRFTATIRERCHKLAALPGRLGTARPELHVEVRSVSHRGYIILFRYRPTALEIVAAVKAERDIKQHFTHLVWP